MISGKIVDVLLSRWNGDQGPTVPKQVSIPEALAMIYEELGVNGRLVLATPDLLVIRHTVGTCVDDTEFRSTLFPGHMRTLLAFAYRRLLRGPDPALAEDVRILCPEDCERVFRWPDDKEAMIRLCDIWSYPEIPLLKQVPRMREIAAILELHDEVGWSIRDLVRELVAEAA